MVWIVAVCAVGLVLLGFLIHSSPVRRMALGRAVAALDGAAGVTLRADTLSYNLLRLRATLTGVRAASREAPDAPFFTADRVEVTLPSSALFGGLSIDRLAIDNARITILRRADGTTNLPSGGTDGGEAQALPIGQLDVPRLAVSVTDESSDASLVLPALVVRLGPPATSALRASASREGGTHDGTPAAGTVRLAQPGRIRRGQVETAVTALGGGVSFDGRTVSLTGLAITTREIDLVLGGTLALLVDEPGMKLLLSGRLDTQALARWVPSDSGAAAAVQGTVAFDGTLGGPFQSPAADARVRSDRLAWNRAVVSEVSAHIAASVDRLQVTDLEASLAGGRVTATGGHAFGTSMSTVKAAWSSLRLEPLLASLESAPTPPLAGLATGSADVQIVGADLTTLSVNARTRIDSPPTVPGRLAAPGDLNLRITDGRWQLDAEHVINNAPVTAGIGGRVDVTRPIDSTVAGVVTVGDSDIPGLLRAWRSAGLLDVADDLVTSGRVEARAVLSGTIAAPRFDITAAGRGVAAPDVEPVDVDLTARGTAQQLAFEARVHHLDVNVVRAFGTVWPSAEPAGRLKAAPTSAGMRLEVSITGRLAEPSALFPKVPVTGEVDLLFQGVGPFSAFQGTGTLTSTDLTYDGLRIGRTDATVRLDPRTVRVDAVSPELSAAGRFDVPLSGRLKAAPTSDLKATPTSDLKAAPTSDLKATPTSDLKAAATSDLAAPTSGERRASFQLRLEQSDLSRVLTWAGVEADASARVSLDARGDVPIDDWRDASAELVATAFDASVDELSARLTAPARASYRERTLEVTSFAATIGDTRLTLAGRLPAFATTAAVPSESLQAALSGDVADVLRTARAAGLADASRMSGTGPMTLLARVTGSAERPIVTADLEVGPSELALDNLPPFQDLHVRAHLADGWIDGVTVSAEWQQSLLSGEARVPLRLFEGHLPAGVLSATPRTTGPASLTLRALAMTPTLLSPYLDAETLAQVEGVVDVSARFQTSSLQLDDLRGDLTLDRLDVQVAGLPVEQREPTRLAVGQGLLRIASWDWAGQGATLGVQGQVRLRDRETAIRAGGRLDMRMLTPFLRDAGITLAGTLAPRLVVGGPLDAPRVEGEVTLTGGDVRLREPRIVATEITAAAVLSPIGARLTSLTGAINGGTLNGAGELDYGADRPTRLRLSGVIAGMGLELPEGLRSELNADLTLALEQAAGLMSGGVSGEVTVLRSAYREPLSVVTGLLSALRTGRLTTIAGGGDSLARRLALDVRIVTEGDIEVDNNLARLQLGGDLRVIGTAAAPSLAGRALLREGGQLFLGQNVYRVDAGTIDFTNPDVIDPDLNIQATTRAGGHEIELTLAGTTESPDVTLRSVTEPELGQADVASLLLTGRVLADVPGAEGRIVGEQVLSYLSGDILGVASRAVGLDTIRLGGVEGSGLRRDPTAVATEADPTSRLTFGKTFGTNVELTYSQSLRDGDRQTWIVDYNPLPKVGLRLVSRDDTLRSYEFTHDVSIGGSETAARAPSRDRARQLVAAVTFSGDTGLPEARLRAAVSVKPGDTFDFSEWQRDRERLEQLLHREGRLEARVTARRQEDTLSYVIDAGPRTAIRVEGYDLREAARAQLEAAWTESVYDGFLQDEAEAIVRAALADDGYLGPQVSSAIVTGDTKTLTLSISPGSRAVGLRVRVDAGDEALSLELDRWLRERGLDEQIWREPEAVTAALVTELRSRGHLNARAAVTAPAAGTAGTAGLVTVTPGPRFLVRDVRFDGASHLDSSTLVEATTPVAARSPYDAVAVEEGRARLTRAYRRAGFLDVQVKADASVVPRDQQVAVAYAIVEGPRQVLRGISIAGNRNIDVDVITRALGLTVGEPLGADAWLQARARLFDTALFQRVDVAVEPLEQVSERQDERPARLVVTVQEWPALRVRYGLQLSEERPLDDVEGRNVTPGVSLDARRRTLFGRAVTVGAAAEYQRRERQARTYLSAPTLFGWPVESLISLERSHQDFADATLVTDRSGISWEQRVQLTPRLHVSYSYRFDRDHTFDTNPEQDPLTPSFDLTVNVARLTGTALFDTRDDPLDTTRGWFVSSNIENGLASLGSEFRFLRHADQVYYFRPWRGLVLASAARLGLAVPLGGQTLIPSELFFSGGARSVRGLPEDGLGERDFFGGPAGGRALVVLNQELRFPVYRWVRGVGFVDAGNVFASPSAIDLGQLTGSVGAGLRITTPFALLRADYARVLSGPSAATGRWTFGIGHAF
jgi:outer membrane protein assembly factor BamA